MISVSWSLSVYSIHNRTLGTMSSINASTHTLILESNIEIARFGPGGVFLCSWKMRKKAFWASISFEIKYPSVQADRGCWSGTAQNILVIDHNATAVKIIPLMAAQNVCWLQAI